MSRLNSTVTSRSSTLAQVRETYTPRGLASIHPIIAAKAEGNRLWDVDGKEYLDFAGGIAVLNVGHNHPRVIQAVQAQLERFTHTCFQVAMYESYIRLTERLCKIAPGDFPKKAVLFSAGAEAVENAVKIARAYTGRQAVVAFTGSFHGRTNLTLTLTGKTKPYKQNFGPFAPEVYHAPFPYAYRGWDTERALGALRTLFDCEVAPDRVAAFVIEPQLGEGGFVPAPKAFLRALRSLCDEYGILLIDDEIQTGFGRTGKMFAIEHSGVVPDLLTVAKSLAAGMPLSGVIGRAEVMDAPDPGGLGGTYAGNPLACAAALAVLDIFAEEDLLARSEQLGRWLRQGFEALQTKYEAVGDVRGLGAMLALELVEDRASKAPAPHLTKHTIEGARERGLLLLPAGLHGNVVRHGVPLTTPKEDVDRAMVILDDCFAAAIQAHVKEVAVN